MRRQSCQCQRGEWRREEAGLGWGKGATSSFARGVPGHGGSLGPPEATPTHADSGAGPTSEGGDSRDMSLPRLWEDHECLGDRGVGTDMITTIVEISVAP